jgi:hypothetical protein
MQTREGQLTNHRSALQQQNKCHKHFHKAQRPEESAGCQGSESKRIRQTTAFCTFAFLQASWDEQVFATDIVGIHVEMVCFVCVSWDFSQTHQEQQLRTAERLDKTLAV